MKESSVEYKLSLDGNEQLSDSYDKSKAFTSGDFKVFILDSHHDDASGGFSVRNFIYQTFDENEVSFLV